MNEAITMENKPLIGSTPRLSSTEFKQLATLVYEQCGINLVEAKRVMLESRLVKRLRVLGLYNFREYIQHLTSKEGIENELVHMIDVVTTNKTDFFREPHHFEYMRTKLLPEFHDGMRGARPFKIWSSACSTGEEPYTLAMVLQDFANQHGSFSYSILASDISTQVLERGSLAIYNESLVAGMPLALKQRYLLKSKDKEKPTVRIVQGLRDKVKFFRHNLMENQLSVKEEMDAIFCRNVLIYFDRKTQMEVVDKLVQRLRPGGYLFIGHSESLHQFQLPITQVRPTIFIKN